MQVNRISCSFYITVSVLLLVAICHAAEASKSKQDEEEKTAKRELQEGNYGLRIQPSSIFENGPHSNPVYNGNEIREQGRPHAEYGPPRLPIAKISDVLSGPGGSFPAAIQSHLYSPVQVYQPRLGSPTAFEVSPPVPSQLAYSEHKIYMSSPNVQNFNNLQVTNQNLPRPQPPSQAQQPQVQFNPFPAFFQLQAPRQSQQILTNEFLPRLDSSRFLPRPNFPQQIYRQVFSEQSGGIPQNIFQQINQLGNQQSYEETVQLSQDGNNEARENRNRGDDNQLAQNSGAQFTSQSQKEGQLIADQFRAQQQQSSEQENANSQPQAVSYASFFVSLPATIQTLNQLQQQDQQPSPFQVPQQQQLPQLEPAPVFKLETQSTQAPFSFQTMTVTTPSPPSTFFTVNDQTPQRIGVVRIRQDLTTPQPQFSSTLEAQASSTTYVTTENPQSSSTLPQSRRTTFSTTQAPFRSRPTLRPARRTTLQSSNERRSTFPSRPTLPPLPQLRRRQTTIHQTYFTSPPPTTSLQPEFEQSLSTLPPQPVTETSPVTLQPQLIQSTFTPLPVTQPQEIQIVSTQPQPLPTLQSLLVTESLSSSTSSPLSGQTPDNQPIPVQSQQFQIYKSEEKIEDQVTPQPQLQLIQGPQQIQQQLQSIQQQLQLIQQQPQFIQQQPQPLQIIQQQAQPFPQPVQSVQEQPISQLVQPVQLIQQQPQLIRPQPQLIQQQPQLIQPQTQLIQPQSQLIQPQPQLIQPQPQLIQAQLQLIPQLPQQIQLIQQNPQTQQQTELSSQSQTETEQKSQQDQENKEKQQQSEKSEKEKKESQESNEEQYYSQFLQNNVFSEELYVQPQHLHPVPVGFPYPTSSLHSSPLGSSPSFLSHTLHRAPSFSSVQYYGKYGPRIFGSWR